MGGDGGNGLALAIGLVMLLIAAGAITIFVLIGRAIARRVAPQRRGAIIFLTLILGVLAGWVAVTATFYESTWDPPPQLRLVTAPGFDLPWVILLEDPRAAQTLDVEESRLPFSATVAEVNVPAGGVVRVRDLGPVAGRMDVDIVWSDGTQSLGSGGGPAPPGSGARSYMAVERPDASGMPRDSALFSDPAAFAAYIAEAEARR